MSIFATSCPACGARIEPGVIVCPRCGRQTAKTHAKQNERIRSARQPHRAHYRSAEYRKNRMARYRLAGGRCEACGTALRGPLFPDGVPWECDHVVPLVEGGTDGIANLRCYCTPGRHHVVKTAADRKIRRGL